MWLMSVMISLWIDWTRRGRHMLSVAWSVYSWIAIATIAIESVTIGWRYMFSGMKIGSGIQFMPAIQIIYDTAIFTIFLLCNQIETRKQKHILLKCSRNCSRQDNNTRNWYVRSYSFVTTHPSMCCSSEQMQRQQLQLTIELAKLREYKQKLLIVHSNTHTFVAFSVCHYMNMCAHLV